MEDRRVVRRREVLHFLAGRLTDGGEAASVKRRSHFTPKEEAWYPYHQSSSVISSVCPGVGHPSGTRDPFFFLLEISFRQLRLCYFVAPSLTRERVCNLLYNCFWALPEQSLLGRSLAELTAIFYSLIWDSPQSGGPGSHIYIPQKQGGPVIPPGTVSGWFNSGAIVQR
jgi:hypothetical protein